MAKGYRRVDRDQPFLFPPDMREWLPAGHVVWLVIEAVRRLDTTVFHARRKTGGAGAAGYDPDMLLTVLVWAYASGITSSRRIERLCQQDVAFRVICAGHLPDHVTVARFRQQFAVTAADLFAQVLVLCARLGMGQVGTVALDGTKIGANASKDANRTEEGLRKLARDLAARHAETDAEEDALFGAGRRGDDDPGDPHTRGERVAAALASLEAERQAREEAEREAAREHLRAAECGDLPPAGRPPAGAGAETARAALERQTAACLARVADWERRKAAGTAGRRRRPVGPEQSSLVRRAAQQLERALAKEAARQEKAAARAPARRNVTDPGSRLMPVRGGGFVQGYNAQNVTSQDGLVIATELTADTADTGWFEPMMTAAAGAAALIAAHRPAGGGHAGGGIGLALADAGYLSEHNLACPGPDRLIATGKHRDLEKRARAGSGDETAAVSGRGSPLIAAMTGRLATDDGITAYRQRSHIGETFHGNIKHNLGFRRLSVRGMRKASGEWQFAAAVHNLHIAITSGHLTPQALAALT
ncbi:MAG TPA: transposase [Streptosporangiaceae bacterium]|nr:transposase [Streptosporangiaceae bacterium]